MCQALIRASPNRRGIAAKMPNSRKKTREFGIASFVAKSVAGSYFQLTADLVEYALAGRRWCHCRPFLPEVWPVSSACYRRASKSF